MRRELSPPARALPQACRPSIYIRGGRGDLRLSVHRRLRADRPEPCSPLGGGVIRKGRSVGDDVMSRSSTSRFAPDLFDSLAAWLKALGSAREEKGRFAVSEAMKWRSFVSALVVISAGSLLHFAWAWSGRSTVVAVFAATNESTWEHLKLAFWPALAVTPIQRTIYGSFPGWLPAAAIRCVLPSFVIVALFYGYTALLGTHHLAADLTIFAFAILAGEFLGHAVLTHEFGSTFRAAAFGLLLVVTALFSTLTFRPPDSFLFHEPPPSWPGEG